MPNLMETILTVLNDTDNPLIMKILRLLYPCEYQSTQYDYYSLGLFVACRNDEKFRSHGVSDETLSDKWNTRKIQSPDVCKACKFYTPPYINMTDSK